MAKNLEKIAFSFKFVLIGWWETAYQNRRDADEDDTNDPNRAFKNWKYFYTLKIANYWKVIWVMLSVWTNSVILQL
jgi:hypothetical protein